MGLGLGEFLCRLLWRLLMIEILHYLKDPKLWEFMGIFLIMGDAGFMSSTVVFGPVLRVRRLWPQAFTILTASAIVTLVAKACDCSCGCCS